MFKYGVWWEYTPSKDRKLILYWEQSKFTKILEGELKKGVSVETALSIIKNKLIMELRRGGVGEEHRES